jgi:hypothetical protein
MARRPENRSRRPIHVHWRLFAIQVQLNGKRQIACFPLADWMGISTVSGFYIARLSNKVTPFPRITRASPIPETLRP